jgi:hypothetical protein
VCTWRIVSSRRNVSASSGENIQTAGADIIAERQIAVKMSHGIENPVSKNTTGMSDFPFPKEANPIIIVSV